MLYVDDALRDNELVYKAKLANPVLFEAYSCLAGWGMHEDARTVNFASCYGTMANGPRLLGEHSPSDILEASIEFL